MPDSLHTQAATHTAHGDTAKHSAPAAATPVSEGHKHSEPATTRDSVYYGLQEAYADTTAVDTTATSATATPVAVEHVETPPPPPAWMSGLELAPRPANAARQPGITGIFLTLFLILAISLRHSHGLFKALRRDLLGIRTREKSFDERTPAQSRLIAVFYIQLVAVLAVLTQCFMRLMHLPGAGDIGGDWSFTTTLLLICVWTAYYLFSLTAYNIVGYAFTTPQGKSHWMRGFNASQVLAGFLLIIPAVVAVFSPTAAPQALTIAATIYVLARLTFIVKGFRIFYTNFVALIYFFLYLCALEIVPVIILYRSACAVVSNAAA